MKLADTIIREGERFDYYAGPFGSLWEAYDYIEAMIAHGDIGEGETVVDHATCTVYQRAPAPPLAPED